MLQIEKISFTDKQILNNGAFVLVDVIPAMNDTESERIGTDIVVALTGHQYEKISVRVSDLVTCSAFDTHKIQPVTFTGFKGYFSLDNTNDWQFTATADQFQVVSP